MSRKTGLGRGLDALIPGRDQQPSGGVMALSIEQIDPNPRQPRSRFDPQELMELAESIREYGVLQPLIITANPDDEDRYLLIAGERRLLAARQAGLEVVPVIIREASDQQRLELALIENVQREDLGPLETAEAYRQLSDDFNLSHEEIASRVSKSRAAVTNTLRLLKLPVVVQAALAEEKISEGHARALLALSGPQAQQAALQTILAKDLNVRQAEELVRRMMGQKTEKPQKPGPPAEIAALEERLRTRFSTKVNLVHHRKGGTIVIHYYSEEELNALIDQLLDEK